MNQTDDLKKEKRKKRLKRFARFSIVTTIMLLSVTGWYYTHYRTATSLIDKFVMVNSALEHSLISYQSNSDQMLETIKRNVKKAGNFREGRESIKRAELLKKKTAIMMTEVEKIKQALVKDAGGGLDEKTYTVKNPRAKVAVSNLMVGLPGGSKGKGYKLQQQLDTYSTWINNEFKDLIKKPFASLTKVRGESDNKNFVDHNFWQKPVVVALAKMSQIQHQILNNELNVLTQLKATTKETDDLVFDKVYTGVSAESNVLRSGDVYRASMMIAAYSSKLKAKMMVNGKPIKVENGIGKVRFKTTYPLGRKYWEGEVTFKSKGRDTTFRIKQEYVVIPRMK